MSMRRGVCVGLILCLPSLAIAQEQPAAPADEPGQTPEPIVASPTPVQHITNLIAAYRQGPLAERIRLRVVGEGGRERTSRIELRIDPGDAARPARLRVDLGRFTFYAQDTSVLILDRYNPGAYAEINNPKGPGQGLAVLPLLPLPQIAWAFGEVPPETSLAPLTTHIQWTQADTDANTNQVWIRGDAAPGSASLLLSGASSRLTSLRIARAMGLASIRMEIEPIDAGDPAAWVPNTLGRTRVESLAELRPPPPDVDVGQRLPGLGLMTSDLRLWTLREELATSVNGRAPAMGVLILYRAGQGEAEALAGWAALGEARDQQERSAAIAGKPLPRILARPVGVLELDEVTPERVHELGEVWAMKGAEPNWTSTGRAMLDRFAVGSHALALVINDEERVEAIIRLDGRAAEPEGIRQDLTDLFDQIARSRSLELPALSAPETNAPAAPSSESVSPE